MNQNIHPLQEKSVDLLNQLHLDLNLPMTGAMLTNQRGYYASIESIIWTLEHYKINDFVKVFKDNNLPLINETIREIEEKELAINNESTLEPTYTITDVFGATKSHPLETFEHSISKSFSGICGENLVAKIVSINESEKLYSRSIEIKLTIDEEDNNDDNDF